LNEAAALPETLAAARSACPDAEIIVVDGGSEDATVALAEDAGATVVCSRRGRGHQQNAGAARASSGDVLLFLHADTLLPKGAGESIRAALAHPATSGGNFRLAFAPASSFNRLFAAVYNFRSRGYRHYYGDSCLWVRREVFDALGGFREGMLMEDWEWTRRLEAYCRESGMRTVCLPLTVHTSARRFTGRRRWRYLWLWAYLHHLHARGVSGDELARLYPDTR
jgi:rSAM/selenodomain-associated transferase 2